ncbi:endopeptidase La [Methylocaldum sp.]|uniref:endopeptidase La n=1 Tax=Methylocaldum sp. TaxID=1969727 RepID=UPI0039C8F3C8
MAITLFVGREKSIRALDGAMQSGKHILVVAQKDAELDEPEFGDLYETGTLSTILQLLKLPDGTVKVLIKGARRCRIEQYRAADSHDMVLVTPLDDELKLSEAEIEALMRAASGSFDQYVKLKQRISPEVLNSVADIREPGRLADAMAAHMSVKIEDKQTLLETADIAARYEKLIMVMENAVDLLEVDKRIRGRVKQQVEKNQREYYLNEQMRAIRKELGEMGEAPDEFDHLAERITKAGMPKAARAKAETELDKLRRMPPMSAEATVVRNYLDWMIDVPWKKRTRAGIDLKKAAALLEAEHYGLDKVKERILEYLAVQQRAKKLKGPILCLVGPPGVGKTSLGQSIARATNRKYVRMALGGVRDEAEIRGHRRTYIGALPGKILQNLAKAKTRNPLFLLDEIDKMATDSRGDPASALLEVLDPEQNHAFNDHYLEVDFDLSDVMFIATANTLNIPEPLLDRMEVIRIAGYTEDEKINIASRYLVPKQVKHNGLKANEIQITDSALQAMIRHYTREAGVRSLEREIATICRKVVKSLLLKPGAKKCVVTHHNLDDFLGVPRYRYGRAEETDRVGQVTGLAWTEVGGELLTIESAVMPGTGQQTYTGKLGAVMQESIRAAMTVARLRAAELGIPPDFYQTSDMHIHVPEGATPKDGPSAGIGMCTALVSALTSIPVRADVAMTGEITLRGEVLPIGGLKEKLLAAHRGGIKTVLIPHENEKDLAEIPKNVKQHLSILPVRRIDEVLGAALQRLPEPLETATLPIDPERAAQAKAGGAAIAH